MKRILLVLTVALVMAAMIVAMAMPAFARLHTVQENGGGHDPKGAAYGVPTYVENDPGHRPPGHNR